MESGLRWMLLGWSLALAFLPATGESSVEASPSACAVPTLPEVVVTASRIPRDAQSEPRTVYGIPADQAVVEGQTRTTPDALRGVPSTLLQKTTYGQGSPYLRGFTGFRTLYLIDGVRLNNSVFREGPNQYGNTIDPFGLAGYELLLGPSSSLYGSDAVGGVLNARLAEPPAWTGTSVGSPALFWRGATADRSSIERLELGLRPTESFGLVGGATLKHFDDLRAGRGTGLQPRTGYDEWDADARADFWLGEHSRIVVAHQTVRQDDVWRTHRTRYGTCWHGTTRGDDEVHTFDQGRDLTLLRYIGTGWAEALDTVELTLSRHAQSEDLYRVRADRRQERQGFDVTTWGAGLQIHSKSAIGDLACGGEFYRDDVDSYARRYNAAGQLTSEEIQGPVADDAMYETLGVYVQDQVPVFRDRIDLTPGIRYTRIRADAERVKHPVSGERFSLARDWEALTASLGVLCPLTADRSYVVFANAGQGFRAPNLSDLTRFDVARSGEVETPSPELDPETFVSAEAGLKVRSPRWTGHFSGYYTWIDGMILRTPTGRTLEDGLEVTKKNSGEGYVAGLEARASVQLGRFIRAWAAGAIMNGKADAYPTSEARRERDYLSRLMPPTAQVGVRVQSAGARWWGEALCDMADKADRLSADDRRDTQRIPPGGTPGYAVGTIRGGTRLGKFLDLVLAVENVWDKDYRIHGSGVNEPGRNVVLTARARF